MSSIILKEFNSKLLQVLKHLGRKMDQIRKEIKVPLLELEKKWNDVHIDISFGSFVSHLILKALSK